MPTDADLLFGQIALRKGYLNRPTLDAMLAEQADLEKDGIVAPLGKLLLGKRLLRPEQVDAILGEQRYTNMREEDKRLGVLAVRNHLASQDHVVKALAAQKAEFTSGVAVPGRLGDYLISLGFIQPQQLNALLRLQQRLQSVAPVASGVLIATPAPAPPAPVLAPPPPVAPAPLPPPPASVHDSGMIAGILDQPVSRPPSLVPQVPQPSFRLVVEEGESPGRLFDLRAPTVFGREKDSDIALDDKKLSRRHASFEPAADGWRVVDLDSKNGTSVNGEKISAPVALHHGDRVHFGHHLMRFERLEPAPTPPALVDPAAWAPTSAQPAMTDATSAVPVPEAAAAPGGGGGFTAIVVVLALLCVLGMAGYLFKDQLLALLPANAPSNDGTPVEPVNRPPVNPRRAIKTALEAIEKEMSSPQADLADLQSRFRDLREKHDPLKQDPDFEAVSALLAAREPARAVPSWPALLREVDQLRKDNRFAEALEKLKAFTPAPGTAEQIGPQQLKVSEDILNDAEQYRVSLTKILREQVASGQRDAAYEHLRDARAMLPPGFSEQLDELEKQLKAYAATIDARTTGKTEEKPPESAKKEDHSAASAQRAAQGRARLEQVKQELVARKGRQAEEEKAHAARVSARTAKSSISVKISDNFNLPDCQVIGFTQEGVTLKSTQATVPLSWEALPARVAYDIRHLAIDDAVAEEHLALGKYCLLRDLFDAADKEFKRALEIAPALRPRIPDTQAFRNRKKIFHGTWSVVGRDLLRIAYDFKDPEEELDFATEGKVAVVKGALEVTGANVVMAYIKDLDFSEFVTLEASGYQGSGAAPMIGLIFRDKAGRQTGLLVKVGAKNDDYQVLRLNEKDIVPAQDPQKMPKDSPIQVRMASLKLEVRVKGKKVWSGPQSEFEQCYVIVGGVAQKGLGTVRYDRVEVEGKAGAEWIKKSLSRMDTLALRQLEDDLRGLDTQTATEPGSVTLSVEERLPRIAAAARERYLWGKGFVDKGDLSHPNEVMQAFDQAVQAAPDFPGAFYYRGLLLVKLDAPGQAVPEFTHAIELDPTFYEALAARAAAWMDLSRAGDAEKDVAAVLRLAPDLAAAYYQQGRLRFAAGMREESVGLLELANALDPVDRDIRLFYKGVRNVQRGPLWKQTYRAETAHFVVRSDISQVRVQFYAQQLEAIAGFYAQTFSIELPVQKADALIFETQEGYQTYAELTLENRVESTLGYYHPVYDQLLLFEDKSEGAGPETLRVIYHEGFHQFIHTIIPHIPFWLNEGVAEYFGASEVKDGKVVRTGLVQEGRLAGLQNYLSQGGKPIPFDNIMMQTPSEFYSGNVQLKYAQAWSMVHFFMGAGAATYRRLLQSYIDSLRKGDSVTEAYGQTFGKIDPRIAEKQWLEQVRKMKVE